MGTQSGFPAGCILLMISLVIRVVDRCPLTREPGLGLGASNDDSLVITESLNRKSLSIPPPPSDIFDGAMRLMDDRGLREDPTDADLCDGGISEI